MFQLGIGDGCAQRVQALIENDVYVYPGQWANTNDGKVSLLFILFYRILVTFLFEPLWLTKSSATEVHIYLNPGLIDLIKTAFFNGPTAFGFKYKEHFVSSHPDRKEPELTMSLVALGATAVRYFFFELIVTDLLKFFAVLWEWREGKKAKLNSEGQKSKGDKFEGDNFKKVYDRHMETLSLLKKKINTYHQVMSTLYSKVV